MGMGYAIRYEYPHTMGATPHKTHNGHGGNGLPYRGGHFHGSQLLGGI